MSLELTAIEPIQDRGHGASSGYTFNIYLVKGKKTWKVNVRAHALLDYQLFRERVLEWTGHVYGGDTRQNWSEEVKRHLDRFWASYVERLSREDDPPRHNKCRPGNILDDDHDHTVVS